MYKRQQQGRRLLGPWPYLATAFYLLQRLAVLLMASDYLYRLYYLCLLYTSRCV